MRLAVLLTGTVILMAGAVGAEDRLSIRVSPAMAFAPANLHVRATVPSHADNRAIEITAESEGFYRSSEIQLDGEAAPKTTTFEFRSLPTGEYAVRAVLKGTNGHPLATAYRRVNIVESGTAR